MLVEGAEVTLVCGMRALGFDLGESFFLGEGPELFGGGFIE
jgi:hypothetical protein